jgi:hypothetical protein
MSGLCIEDAALKRRREATQISGEKTLAGALDVRMRMRTRMRVFAS